LKRKAYEIPHPYTIGVNNPFCNPCRIGSGINVVDEHVDIGWINQS
jgi:hypothetical protein